MKALLAALLIITSSLFGQNINATSDGPIYDRDGRMIAYKYADGTRDLYTYDSQWRMTSFTDRAGNVTHFLSSSQGADNTMSESTTATSAPVDQTLYTRYDIYTGSPFVDYCVCGSTQQSSGCYSCGNLGPFGKVGALIEGNPST